MKRLMIAVSVLFMLTACSNATETANKTVVWQENWNGFITQIESVTVEHGHQFADGSVKDVLNVHFRVNNTTDSIYETKPTRAYLKTDNGQTILSPDYTSEDIYNVAANDTVEAVASYVLKDSNFKSVKLEWRANKRRNNYDIKTYKVDLNVTQ